MPTASDSDSAHAPVFIREGTKEDVAEASRVMTLARATNKSDWVAHPQCYSITGDHSSPGQQEALAKLAQKRMGDIGAPRHGPSQNFFVAMRQPNADKAGVDEGSQELPTLVGYVRWEVLPQGTSEAEWQVEHSKEQNIPILIYLEDDINPGTKVVIGVGVPHIRLSQVYVHPEYRRQGIGSTLMALALQEADELNLPVFIEATPEGYHLYATQGFEVRKKLSWDLSPFGLDSEPYLNHLMWRPSRSL